MPITYWLIFLGFIIVLIFLPVSLSVTLGWRQGSPVVAEVRLKLFGGLLPLRFRRLPRFIASAGKPDKAKGKKAAKKKKNWKYRTPNLGLLQATLPHLGPLLRQLLAATSLRRLQLYLTYGSGDAADTGIFVGRFWAIAPLLHQWGASHLPAMRNRLRYGLTPVFHQAEFGVDFKLHIALYPALVLILGVRTFILYRRLMKIWRYQDE